uniref:Ankyrin repeat and SOCS box containing 6 n=1 Tax=Amphilophus citrinellus TaxID=61819 RepID=A0A3Q0SYC5_AMPCI
MPCSKWRSEGWCSLQKSFYPVSYYNPLHIAVLRNRPNMVRLLAGHGADIEKRDRIHESSPLDLASEESERLPCLLTLLDLGADVNARDKHGKTPLLHALASSDGITVHNTENIQLLLERDCVFVFLFLPRHLQIVYIQWV